MIVSVSARAVDFPSTLGFLGYSDWKNFEPGAEQSSLLQTNSISGDFITTAGEFSLGGRSRIYVDPASAVVYFGMPTTKFDRLIGNTANVGVPFLDLSGGLLQKVSSSKVEFRIDAQGMWVNFIDYQIAGGTEGISFQVVPDGFVGPDYDSRSQFRVNWKVVKSQPRFFSPQDLDAYRISFFDGSLAGSLQTANLVEILNASLASSDVVLYSNGAPNPNFVSGFQSFSDPLVLSSNGSVGHFAIPAQGVHCNADGGSSGFACGFGVQAFISGDSIWQWGEFSSIDITFKANLGSSGDKWNVWFFEESKVPTTDFLGKDFQPSSGVNDYVSLSIPTSEYVSNVKPLGADVVGSLPVTTLKIMAAYAKKDASFDLKSIVLRRTQPPSLRFIGIPNQNPPPPPPTTTTTLSVTVIGSNLPALKVIATPQDGTVSDARTVALVAGKGTLVVPTKAYNISIAEQTLPAKWMFLPETRQWLPNGDPKLYFQAFNSQLAWTAAVGNLSVSEGSTASVDLSTWTTDPLNVGSRTICSVRDNVPSLGLAWSFDATHSVLQLGNPETNATGTTTLAVSCVGVTGSSIQTTVQYTVNPVNDPPTIRLSTLSMKSGGALDVNLSETFSGIPRWVLDPDDSYLNLTWTAAWESPPLVGASVAVQDRHLILGAPATFQGDLVLKLTAKDPSGAETSRDVVVHITSPDWSIVGLQGSQSTIGSLVFTFSSRYSSEPVALQKDQVEIQNQGAWIAFPAALEVLRAPSFTAGTWTDGSYRVTLSPSSTTGSTARSLGQVLANSTRVVARLPLSASGKQRSESVTVDPVDFAGPQVPVILELQYDPLDTLHQHPSIVVSWQTLPSHTVPTRLELLDVQGHVLSTTALEPSSTSGGFGNLEDDRLYHIRLVAQDANGNLGGGGASRYVPSGRYPTTIVLGDDGLPDVTGRLFVDAALPAEYSIPLSRDAHGSYMIGNLTVGPHYVSIDDPRWIGEGGVLAINVTRGGGSRSWRLLPRKFLEASTVVVEQNESTGDLVIGFDVLNPFEGERPYSVQLGIFGAGNAKSQVVIPVSTDEFVASGSHWKIHWSRAKLPPSLFSDPVFASQVTKKLRNLEVSTTLDAGASQTSFRSDAATFDAVKSAGRHWSFSAPTGSQVGQKAYRVVDEDGFTTWSREIIPTHGATWGKHLCLREADESSVCSDLFSEPTQERLAFVTDIAGAFPFASQRSLEEVPSKPGVVRAPEGSRGGFAQWMVWIPRKGDYTLQIKTESGRWDLDPVKMSVDTGRSWLSDRFQVKGWNSIGTATVDSGWRSVSLRLPEGVNVEALALVAKGGAAPKSSLPRSSDPIGLVISKSLQFDRIYDETDTLSDRLGNSVTTPETFDAVPQGMFSDLTVVQDSGTGDLVLRTTTTTFDASKGRFTLDFAGSSIEPLVQNSGKGLLIRIKSGQIPTVLRDSLASRPGAWTFRLYNSIDYTTTSSWRTCNWLGYNCHTQYQTVPHTATSKVRLRWTGNWELVPTSDVRPLPPLTVDVVHRGLDSLALRVTGLDKRESSRLTAPGVLHATWSPGSQCASSTTRIQSYRDIFRTDLTGRIAFNPRSVAMSRMVPGKELKTNVQPGVADGYPGAGDATVVQQWLDRPEGGGFYPDVKLQSTTLSDNPWVGFLIRNPTTATSVVRLAFVPGPKSGQDHQKFQYRLQPHGSVAERPWLDGAGYRAANGSNSDWMFATLASNPSPDLLLEPGLNELQVRMVDPAVQFSAFALVPVDGGTPASLPTLSSVASPTQGQEGMFEEFLEAGSLSPSTLHEFTIQAEDRWGNLSPEVVLTASTLAPATKLPAVRVQVPEIDPQGWVNTNIATATYAAFGEGVMPDDVVLVSRLVRRRGTDRVLLPGTERTVTSVRGTDGGWSSTLDLSGYAVDNLAFAAGDRIVVEAWLASGNSTGRHSVVEFGVRSQNTSLTITGLEATQIGGIRFEPRVVWQDGTDLEGTIELADLLLPGFSLQEGDTARDHLVLRGARITRTGNQIATVRGGVFQAERCHLNEGVESSCAVVSTLPTSMGRWAAWIQIEGLQVASNSNGATVVAKEFVVVDDLGRPARSTGEVRLDDNGPIEPLSVSKDRFWFKNIVASTEREAFGIEACYTTFTRSGATLSILTSGCTEGVGPFLTFPWHLQTDGAWSVIGQAFDSMPRPYTITWSGASPNQRTWVGDRPASAGALSINATPIKMDRSALRGVFGASLWGYSVRSYEFGPSGVTKLVFDLLAPDGSVTPYQNALPQVLKSFVGGSILSSSTIMDGRPYLSGSCMATSSELNPDGSSKSIRAVDAQTLRLGQNMTLEGATTWIFQREAGLGWTLRPTSASSELVITRDQIAGWKYSKIGSTTQAADRLAFPITSLLLGPNRYLEVAGGQNVEIETHSGTFAAWMSSAIVKTRIDLNPMDQSLLQSVTTPKVELDGFFTNEDGGELPPVSADDVELRLDGEFGMADIEGVGDAPVNSQVRVAGTPWVLLHPSSKFQILANRGQVFVRLSRPQASLHLTGGASESSSDGAPTTEVQSAVLTTARMPVAVGAELPVPESFQPYQLGNLGSLELSSLSLDASTTVATTGAPTARLALTGATVFKLGSLFDRLGMGGWKLPIRSVTVGLNADASKPMTDALNGDLSFETSPLPLALRAELTRDQIRTTVLGSSPASSASPVLVRLTTAGLPIEAKYADDELDFQLADWELELTNDFPIEAMQNTVFHLDLLKASVGKASGFKLKKLQGSGEILTDRLAIAPYVGLLGAPGTTNGVSVKLVAGEVSSKFQITASRIEIGNKTYAIGCPGEAASLVLGLDGDLEGDICFELNEDIGLYPLSKSSDWDVWIPAASSTPAMKVRMAVKNGVFTLALTDVALKTKPILPLAKGGLDLKGSFTLQASGNGLVVKYAHTDGPLTLGETYEAFWFGATSYSFDYSRDNDLMTLSVTPEARIKNADASCTGAAKGTVSFVAKPSSDTKSLGFEWNLAGSVTGCTIRSVGFDAKDITVTGKNADFTINAGTLSVYLRNSGNLGSFGSFFKGNDPKNTTASGEMGLTLVNVRYVNSPVRDFSIQSVTPYGFDHTKAVSIEIPGVGVVVSAVMDFKPLLVASDPGLLFKDVSIKFPDVVGGYELNSNFGILFNGVDGYVHPVSGKIRIPFALPEIDLKTIKFDEAKLVLRQEVLADRDDFWVLEGKAKVSMAAAIEKIDAYLLLKTPGKPCETGVCQANLTIKLAKGSQIPIGPTGLFLTGLRGGFYDGPYQPPCAKECTGEDMATGKKMEVYAFIEGADPNVVKGGAGLWVHLSELEFGLNGDLRLLRGVATAKACAALFGGGKRFHGDFLVFLDAGLLADGRFVIDIWSDRRGKNLAAEAQARVGLGRGALVRSRWFKFPRSTRWFGPYLTRFGRFQSGSNGFVAGLRALGKTWGVGYVDGGFRLGNVGKYKLAKPTSGALSNENLKFVDGANYHVYPLGLDLKGGEVVSVNVGSADGEDWNGARIELLEPDRATEDDGFGNVVSATYVINDALTNQGLLAHEDSANLHSMTLENRNQGAVGKTKRFMVGIPTNAKPAEGQTTGPVISSGMDDLQVLVSLIDPEVNLKAKTCDDDPSVICISGSVNNFHNITREISTNYSSEDEKLFSAGKKPAAGRVLAQRHRLQLFAREYSIRKETVKDSTVPVPIPLSEIVGMPAGDLASQGIYSLADLRSCVVPNDNAATLELTNCRWKPTNWASGRYELLAGVELEDLLDASTSAIKPRSDAEVVLLDKTRKVLPDAAGTDPVVFDVVNPVPVHKVQGLAVFGSNLDSIVTGGRNEKRLVAARWNAQEHPEIIGYRLGWTDKNQVEHLLEAGPSGEWDFEVPLRKDYLATGNDADIPADESRVVSGSAIDWIFDPPTSLKVTPVLRRWKPELTKFETELHPELSTTWTGTVVPGVSRNLSEKAFTLGATGRVDLRLDQSVDQAIQIDQTNPSEGLVDADLRPESDYARVDVRWVNSENQPITDSIALQRAPSVLVENPAWRIGEADRKSLRLTFSATSLAAVCDTSRVKTKAADNTTDSLLSTTACKAFDTVAYPTRQGTHLLQVRVWNLGRLSAPQAVTLQVPVDVAPPKAKIDRAEPDYLVAQLPQTIQITSSQVVPQLQPSFVKPRLRLVREVTGRWVDVDAQVFEVGQDVYSNELNLDTSLIRDGRYRGGVGLKIPAGWDDSKLGLRIDNPGTNSAGVTTWVEGEISWMIFIGKPAQLACRREDASVNDPGYEYSMDMVGLYPKVPRVGDTLRIQFSEVYAPSRAKWSLWVQQGNDVNKEITTLTTDQEGVHFVLPSGFDEVRPLRYSLTPDASTVIGACNQTFTATSAAPQKKLDAPRLKIAPPWNADGRLVSADASANVFSYPSLRSLERVEWVLGTPHDGQAWEWRSGKPTWGEIFQTDSVHIRIRHRDIGVLREDGFLVETAPRLLRLEVDGRELRSHDVVSPMARIVPRVLPQPRRGLDGTSRMELQCRFAQTDWKTCEENGWLQTNSRSGLVELRVVWHVSGRGEERLVVEPTRSWILDVRDPAQEGIVRVPLILDGDRLTDLLDTATGIVTLLRRQGDDLPIWGTTAPVVRTAEGELLPQTSEIYDPVHRVWSVWLGLPALRAGHPTGLEIWIGDRSVPVSAWSSSSTSQFRRLGDGSAVGSNWGVYAVAPGGTASLSIPPSAGSWSLSFWTSWNSRAETLISSVPLDVGFDDSGAVWARLGSQTIRSDRRVLDTLGPQFVAISSHSGNLEIWSNGVRVANGRAAIPEGTLQVGTLQLHSNSGIDELRWEPWRSEGTWPVRYAAESRSADLWRAWTPLPTSTPARAWNQAAYRASALVPAQSPWTDRDQTVDLWPVAWGGGLLLRGQASDAGKKKEIATRIELTGYAQICGIGGPGWNPGQRWTRHDDLMAQEWSGEVWCREFGPGEASLPGVNPVDSTMGRRSWIVLPSAAKIQTRDTLQPGGHLSDSSIAITIPGKGLVGVSRTEDGKLVREPGDLLVIVPKGSKLPEGAVVLDSLRVRRPDGRIETRWLVRWPDDVPLPNGVDAFRRDPVFEAPILGDASLVLVERSPITFLDGSTTNSWRWFPAVVPSVASVRVFSMTWESPVDLWLALPSDADASTMTGWTRTTLTVNVTSRDGSSTEAWTVWTRSIPAGPFTLDASNWFGPGETPRFLLSGEPVSSSAPAWSLSTLRLRGVGGPEKLQGGRHLLSDLDMQFAAALALRGTRHSLRLSGVTGIAEHLGGVVQGLGPSRMERQPAADGTSQSILVTSRASLFDLRADLLDADSVVVDVQALRAQGTVRLTVKQHGAGTFLGGLTAQLFRDRNGDLAFTQGIDELLGTGTVGSLAAGQSQVVDFRLAPQAIRYPEELFIAWIDGKDLPEVVVGSHTAMAGNPCLERKNMAWSQSIVGMTEAILVHMRDTDGDGAIRSQDSLDTLRVRQGQICFAPTGEALQSWCRATSAVGSVTDLAVRDVDGDGFSEILAGTQILRRDGSVMLDLAAASLGSMKLDVDEDGLLDEIMETGACRAVQLGNGRLAWAAGCSEVGTWSGLGLIDRHLEGCVDASLSGIEVRSQTITVRLANAGSASLNKGLQIVLRDATDTEVVRTSSNSALAPGQWEDIWLPRPAHATEWSVEIETSGLTAQGLLDFDLRNNQRSWSATPETQP